MFDQVLDPYQQLLKIYRGDNPDLHAFAKIDLRDCHIEDISIRSGEVPGPMAKAAESPRPHAFALR